MNKFIDSARGYTVKLGDNVSTDLIHPASYFSLEPARVKTGLFKGFADNVRDMLLDPGRIIMAGRNFGCGSSREVVVQSLVYNNIKVLIAADFARIFLRNCLNNDILCLAIGASTEAFNDGDVISLSLKEQVLQNQTTGILVKLDPELIAMMRMLAAYQKLIQADCTLKKSIPKEN